MRKYGAHGCGWNNRDTPREEHSAEGSQKGCVDIEFNIHVTHVRPRVLRTRERRGHQMGGRELRTSGVSQLTANWRQRVEAVDMFV